MSSQIQILINKINKNITTYTKIIFPIAMYKCEDWAPNMADKGHYAIVSKSLSTSSVGWEKASDTVRTSHETDTALGPVSVLAITSFPDWYHEGKYRSLVE